MTKKTLQINLILNPSRDYDKMILEGIGHYIRKFECHWEVFCEEDIGHDTQKVKCLYGDGIIGNIETLDLEYIKNNSSIPAVAIGGSFQNNADYPEIPYIATNNASIISMAINHLLDKGIYNLGFYGLPDYIDCQWAHERAEAFRNFALKNKLPFDIHTGPLISAETWNDSAQTLLKWLANLPKPIGIVAINETRARQLIQTCQQLKLEIPTDVAIINIGNDEVMDYLTHIPVSQIEQNCYQLGFEAARRLHDIFIGTRPFSRDKKIIEPTAIKEKMSTQYRINKDPLAIKAAQYIHQKACQGIKVSQVVDYVGISRSNLEQRFESVYEVTLHTAIHQTKLKEAKHFLQQTNLPISEVAINCGYPSTQYLYAVFQRDLGMTPKEYRCQKKAKSTS